jgi:hypothetical protein
MNHKTDLFVASLLLILCFALFAQTINSFFTGEDFINIHHQSLKDVVKNFMFKPDQRMGHFVRGITVSFFGLEYSIFGKTQLYYHIFNIIFHWLISFLVYKAASHVIEDNEESKYIAAACGILFAALPVHAIVVNWITLLFEKFCTLFFILGFFSWVRLRNNQKIIFYYLTLAMFICSLLSKEEAITFPIVIYVFDKIYYWEKEKGLFNLFTSIKYYIPLFMISGLFVPYRIFRFGSATDFANHSYLNAGLLQNIKYIWQMLSDPFSIWFIIIIWLFGFVRRNKALYFATCWIGIVLIPVYHIPTEWRVYLASVGFCIGFIVSLHDILTLVLKKNSQFVRVSLIVLLIPILILYSSSIIRKNKKWNDATVLSENLYTKVKKQYPVLNDGIRIYFKGLEDANDVCSANLFDWVAHFMYEKDIRVRDYATMFSEAKNITEIDPKNIMILEYRNGNIIDRSDLKKSLIECRWSKGLSSQSDVNFSFDRREIMNLKTANPKLTFTPEDSWCEITSGNDTIVLYFDYVDLDITYINSIHIRMKIDKKTADTGEFFFTSGEFSDKNAKFGKRTFKITESFTFQDYIIPLGDLESWFMLSRIKGFGIRLPASSADIEYIKFTPVIYADAVKKNVEISKPELLQPIPAR